MRDINANKIKFKAVVASPNKCLEGVPGINFVIAKTIDFKRCKGISDNLSMDLHDQWNTWKPLADGDIRPLLMWLQHS